MELEREWWIQSAQRGLGAAALTTRTSMTTLYPILILLATHTSFIRPSFSLVLVMNTADILFCSINAKHIYVWHVFLLGFLSRLHRAAA
jgi:hypothetical protein